MKTKKRIFLAAVGATFLSLNILFAQHEAPIRTEYCPAICSLADVPFIDGVADEASWSAEMALTEMFNAAGYNGNESDLSGYVKVCWNNANLYFFADITDDVAINWDGGSTNSYDQDNVEVFLDLDTTIINADGAYIGDELQLRYNRGYNVYTGNAPRNGASFDDFVQVNGSGSWQVEAVIPWLSFMPEGTLPEDVHDYLFVNAGAIGFDVAFADNDTELGTNRDAQMAWDADVEGEGATEDNAWKDTRVFGTINLAFTWDATTYTNSEQIEIYPNPAHSELRYKKLVGVNKIELINLTGQKLKVVNVSSEEITLNLEDLIPGTYFTRLSTNEGFIVRKIVVE
ncbi:MAG: T9SS type A sorting domain-containing protein [Bacteroidales bacterium]|nr:T9SS type A sorting domain-containing protein [Bacteroidales bacterium]MBN2819191.1 T9SS type A sorting domain-containing protein [Bacteroidales bacterium]